MVMLSLQSLGSGERARLDQLVEELRETVRLDEKIAELNEVEQAVWRAVLRAFAERGHAPDRVELGSLVPGRPDTIASVLRDLAAKDIIVLDDTTGGIVAAYPFSARPTPHRVTLDGREVYALCAIDALGIAGMLKRPIQIDSTCAHCGARVSLAVTADGETITEAEPSSTLVWAGVAVAGQGCCAVILCPEINFFCSPSHLEAWRQGHLDVEGEALGLLPALYVANRIFARLLDEGR